MFLLTDINSAIGRRRWDIRRTWWNHRRINKKRWWKCCCDENIGSNFWVTRTSRTITWKEHDHFQCQKFNERLYKSHRQDLPLGLLEKDSYFRCGWHNYKKWCSWSYHASYRIRLGLKGCSRTLQQGISKWLCSCVLDSSRTRTSISNPLISRKTEVRGKLSSWRPSSHESRWSLQIVQAWGDIEKTSRV